ncbi:cAMP receptor protein [Labrenzia sp. THAF82]|uniref:Crp/Fnr family transcriptional regulator n=1 Tax=Labrenzia sp. THAF82 TaxID=2587861 RepID=UPI0012697F89|nr:Crp/Fnr family transcriptional regulator [Labrenzia sp. THAF82]QFT34014.1 cAMP receptor protein [Labrenzia sp. THAF82]
MFHWPKELKFSLGELEADLLANARRNALPDGGVIYLQDDPADVFYIVLSGYVRLSYILEDGTSILYAVVPPGNSFGELGVLDRSVYQDTASAIGPVSYFTLRADLFHSGGSDGAKLMGALNDLVVERYKTYIEATKVLYLGNLTSRLALSIIRLARMMGQRIDIDGAQYEYLGPMVTQSDLGSMARGTRGNVNRILKKWQKSGLITVVDRKIILLKPSQLEQECFASGG